MKINYMYGSSFGIYFHCYNGEQWQWGWDVHDLNLATSIAEDALDNDKLVVPKEEIEFVRIISEVTGEIILDCFPDDNSNDIPDWDYNEDCGFDPYEGYYTEDC